MDNFAGDASLRPEWTTPALGEAAMQLDTSTRELTGVGGGWDASLWNAAQPFGNPVEVWATIGRAGVGDATLYANVSGGASGTQHPVGGYFVDFGGPASGGSRNQVSLVRINGSQDISRLSYARAPYTSLQPGDQIGISVNDGVIIAWYKTAASSTWTAVVSTVDKKYTSGNIAIEAIPGADYGFTAFGGGTPTTPVVSAQTTTTITASAARIPPGGAVTYSAKVTPAPSAARGSFEFLDNNVIIPACAAVPVDAAGHASCTVSYGVPGTHIGSAIYTGSSDGAVAGSENDADAITTVMVPNPTITKLSLSSATPLVGERMLYSARVAPTPDGGTVLFTDNGKPIRKCASRPVTRGLATCGTAYRGPGVHRIGSAYRGDSNDAASTAKPQTVTVSARPRVRTANKRVVLIIACPRQSGGCRIAAQATLRLSGARPPIVLAAAGHTFRTGRSGLLSFLLKGKVEGKVRSYLAQHQHARLRVTARLTIRNGNGSRGTQTISSVIAGSRNIGQL